MDSPLIAIDIGNTSTRFGYFDEFEPTGLTEPARTLDLHTGDYDFEKLMRWVTENPAPWRAVSVHRDGERRLSQIAAAEEIDLKVLRHSDFPLTIDVHFPDQVGTDRLAAALAAYHLTGAAWPAIAVDVGTAVTVDLVTADGVYCGGAIMPGTQMTANALSDNTDLLPMISYRVEDEPPAAIGKSTEEAIRSALFWGTVGGIRELIARISQHADRDPRIYFTGADGVWIAPHVHPTAQFVPHLVLKGIALSVSQNG